jgi:hypothetical protein
LSAAEPAASESTAASESSTAAEAASAYAGASSATAPAESLRLSIAWNEKSAHCQSANSQENPVHRHPPFRRNVQPRHEARTRRKPIVLFSGEAA